MTQLSERVFVLDRDGTINADTHYLRDPRDVRLLDGSAEALRRLREAGCRVVVITNQSGVGRGLMSVADVAAVNARLVQLVEEAGGRIEAIYVCPHRPDEGCACRKPGTALLEQAAREMGFDAARSVVVGDKCSDVEMGRRAGACTVLISGRAGAPAVACRPDHTAADLRDAVACVAGEAGAGLASLEQGRRG